MFVASSFTMALDTSSMSTNPFTPFVYHGKPLKEFLNNALLDVFQSPYPKIVDGFTITAFNPSAIPRHTSIPATKSQVFSTASDNQPRLELRLVQGEVPLAADNDFVGRLIVDAIPLAPRGTPRLEITFIVDEDGAIDVKARDCATDRELVAWVDASGDGQ